MAIRRDIQRTIERATQAVYDEIAAELDTLGRLETAKRRKVVATWSEDSRPTFGWSVYREPSRITLSGTVRKGQIYRYVDEGTRGPYPIRPRTPGGRLVFQTGYSARTAPVAQYNQGSGQATGDWVSTPEVMHPGIEARKFEETFVGQLDGTLTEVIDNAIRRGLRRKR